MSWLASLKVTAKLWRGFMAADPVPSPDGEDYVITTTDGNYLVSSTGATIRHLNSNGAGCAPVRWWNAATLLATCTMSPPSDSGDQQMWLIPENGGKPTALTPLRPVDGGPDQSDFNFAQLASGDYVEAEGATCGNHVVARLEPHGEVTTIKVPGATESEIESATASRLLLLTTNFGCGSGSVPITRSLVWLDPKTGAETAVIRAVQGQFGVTSVVPFYDVGQR